MSTTKEKTRLQKLPDNQQQAVAETVLHEELATHAGTGAALGDVFLSPDPNDPERKQNALMRRKAAAEMAYSRPHAKHLDNGDENQPWPYPVPFSFTKGLPHDPIKGTILDLHDYAKFVKAIYSGLRADFRQVPLGHEKNYGDNYSHHTCTLDSACSHSQKRSDGIDALKERIKAKHTIGNPALDKKIKKLEDAIAATKPEDGLGVRAWESQSAGLAYELEGPDAQAVTMPPAPAMGSDELIFEMAEVYAQALLRDIPLAVFQDHAPEDVDHWKADAATIVAKVNDLLDMIDPAKRGLKYGESFTVERAFRGITPGDHAGPYLSQFMIQGSTGINGNDEAQKAERQLVTYGAITVNQEVRFALPYLDYMTTWDEWYAVQCAAAVGGFEVFANEAASGAPKYRGMGTPRDLSTYVHYDALYEAYLNACLLLLAKGAPFDPGIPFQAKDFVDHQQGFAHFGGPHILSLVTEVATRALKAVRFQKFNVHRRLRPEALAGRIEKSGSLGITDLTKMTTALKGITKLVEDHNKAQHGGKKSKLLPMAFSEGSPMHPAYGAGHATVAGACVTILKAFFDGSAFFKNAPSKADKDSGKWMGNIFTPVPTYGNKTQAQIDACRSSGIYDTKLKQTSVGPHRKTEISKELEGKQILTVEDELNKLAANISIGRDWAGVHYYSDYAESLKMGEKIAIGILQEQKMMFGEHFSMSFTRFDGTPLTL